jgi:hypothetical protein
MDEKIQRTIDNLDALDGFVTAPGPKTEIEKQVDAATAKALEETAGPAYGPLRKAPTYYIGESIGCNGKGSFYGRALTARRDTERLKNGALPGIRNKAARRMLRKAFRNAYSRTEQSVLKARDLVNEVRGYADSGHEGKRNIARLDAAHTPAKVDDNRTARQQMRKARKHHKKQWAKAIDRMSKSIYELGNA